MKLEVSAYSSFYSRARGLIGETRAKNILLKTRFGIHTFGVKFPIDVVILDKENCVVRVKERLKPNSFFFWPVRYNTVLELPSQTIKEQEITPGMRLDLLVK
jgi:hypothetical protein